MKKLTKHPCLWVAFLFFFLCYGCFQAQNPFYRESDIATDKRLEGLFVTASTNSSSALSQSVLVKPAKNRHYDVTCREGDKWAELDAVLFNCGTNLFLDLKRVADNGVHSEPTVGPSSGMEILQMATMGGAHFVLRIRFVDGGIQSSDALYGNALYRVLNRHPNLKYETSIEGQPLDPHIRIITNSTEDLHDLLVAEGGNEKVFAWTGATLRRKEQ